MKILLLFSVLVTCNGLPKDPIESFSKDATYKTPHPNLIHSLSEKTDSYYYAYCKERKTNHFEECEITEEIPVTNGAFYTKTCRVKYDTSAESGDPEVKYLKSWGEHRVLLVDYNKKTLEIQQINMTSCVYSNVSILNLNEFQVYVTSDSQFDVLWTSDGRSEAEYKNYIVRNTYGSGGAVRAESALYAPRPHTNVADLSDTWEALFLVGNTSYHRETRKTKKEIQEVVFKVHPDHTNKTDLVTSQGYEKLLTSNAYGELGACLVSKDSVGCKRYDADGKIKAKFTLSYSDLVRGHESPRSLVLHNLKDGKSMFLILNRFVEAKEPIMRSFTAVVVHPDGHYEHPLEVEFYKWEMDFKCSSKIDPIKRKEIPPAVNVVDTEDKFCFQFICSDLQESDLSQLRYRMKCAKKELFGAKDPAKSGHVGFSGSLFLIGTLSALVTREFVQ